MGTRLDETTRKRNRFAAIESATIRPEVEATLAEIAERTPCSPDVARDRFFFFCQQGAKERSLKFFAKGTDGEGRQGYRQALALLLGEKIAPSGNGRFSTGVNMHWVVEIWRAGLDRYYHRKEFGLGLKKEEGVRVFVKEAATVASVAPAQRPLSLRVLEAHTTGSTDQLMKLVLEIEKLEGKG